MSMPGVKWKPEFLIDASPLMKARIIQCPHEKCSHVCSDALITVVLLSPTLT